MASWHGRNGKPAKVNKEQWLGYDSVIVGVYARGGLGVDWGYTRGLADEMRSEF